MTDPVKCPRCGWSWGAEDPIPDVMTLDAALELSEADRRLLLITIREVWRKRGCGLAALSVGRGLRVLEAPHEATPSEDVFHLHPTLVAEFAETMSGFAEDGRIDAQGRVLPPA